MPNWTPDQQNYYYLQEAERAGIHKAILPVLDQAQSSPSLADGETGLGISPANRIKDLETDFTKLPQPNLAYLERSLLAIALWHPRILLWFTAPKGCASGSDRKSGACWIREKPR